MNSSLRGSNIITVKAHNMRVVLLNLLYEEYLSRIELAERTNLSNTTISNLISELLEEGLVQECDIEKSEIIGNRPVGRPRTSICLKPNARFVIGIHVGVGMFRVAINNLKNEIVFSSMENYAIKDPPLEVLEQIAKSIETLIAVSKLKKELILGIGIGLSGIVDFETGINVFAPNLGWKQVPAKAFLSERLDLPVIADNNVRCMALGETYFGNGRELDSLVFVYGRVGVGAGFICKGQVFRGSTMGAGEFGHNIVLLEDGDLSGNAKYRELESLVSETAILKQAEEIISKHPDGILANLMPDNQENLEIDYVIKSAEMGDPIVQSMLANRAHYLGIALLNMVNLYNPELIILGGLFAQAGKFFIEPVTETVKKMAFADLGKRVRIEATQFSWKAGVIGAAALALTTFFYFSE
jgi:predicted NBD/HSP70 family sugar kinase/biotin operon repressor